MLTVLVPAALQPDAGGERRLLLPASDTLAAVLDRLERDWPRLGRRLRDEQGQLRRYVNIYIDGEDCRRIGGLAAPVGVDAEIRIIPSVAGGAGDDAGHDDGRTSLPGVRLRDSLAAWLAGVTFVDRTSDQVTGLLVDAVTAWGKAQGWRVYRRAASVFPLPPPYGHQHSWLDVACARPDGPPVVVEVDRGARRRSAEKLLAEAEAGRIPIWVRWGDRPVDPSQTPVPLVGVRVTGRRAVNGGRLYSHIPTPDLPAPAHTAGTPISLEQVNLFEAPA